MEPWFIRLRLWLYGIMDKLVYLTQAKCISNDENPP